MRFFLDLLDKCTRFFQVIYPATVQIMRPQSGYNVYESSGVSFFSREKNPILMFLGSIPSHSQLRVDQELDQGDRFCRSGAPHLLSALNDLP